MNLKSTILCAILCILVAAAMFCAGMHHAVTHLDIETDGYGDSAIVTLHGQSHLYGINGCTINGETQCAITVND